MSKTSRTLAASLVLSLSLTASATEWHSFGARAMGMGGAGVALPQGPLSSYWNPASIGLDMADNAWGLQLPVSARATITGTTLQGANDLHAVVKDCQASPQGPLCTSANISAALSNLGAPGNGALGDLGAGANLKIKSITVFVDDFAYVGAVPKTDLVNVSAAAGPTFVGNNQSKLTLRGISATEFGVGYGREIPHLKGFYAGANLKLISAKVGYYDYFIANNNAGDSGSLNKFTDGAKQSANVGVDVGVLWDLSKTFEAVPMHPRVGLAMRDINDPKFSQPDQAKAAGQPNQYSLQGQSRLGVSISPLKSINIVADGDLTHNLTPLESVVSQTVGVGAEINFFNTRLFSLPVRAGLSKNIAMAGTKTAVSLGTGLHFLHVNFDVSGMAGGSQTVQTEGKSTKIPAEAGVAAQLGIQFGGASK